MCAIGICLTGSRHLLSAQYISSHHWQLKINLPELMWLKLWVRHKTKAHFSGVRLFPYMSYFCCDNSPLAPHHTSIFSPVFPQYFLFGAILFIHRYNETYLFSSMQMTCSFCEMLQQLSLEKFARLLKTPVNVSKDGLTEHLPVITWA